MNCRPRLYKGTFSFSRYSLHLEMASLKQSREDPNLVANQSASNLPNSGVGGVCMMSNAWREGQHSSFISFISSFLSANCFRLNFVPIPPDFIFNCGGLSVAFVFLTTWDCNNIPSIFSRIHKLKGQFANLIVAVTLPTREQNDSFVHSYFKYEMEVGRPLFMPVQDLEMGFVMIVNVAQSYGACKQQDSLSRMKTERKQAVENMESFFGVVTSIPGIDRHDAIMLNQTIGSIETIAKLSKEKILESTDLSAEKAETITRFFRDPKFYLSPKLC